MYFVSAWYHRLCVHAKFSIVWCTSYVHDARNYCIPVLYIQSTQPYLYITVQIQIQKIHTNTEKTHINTLNKQGRVDEPSKASFLQKEKLFSVQYQCPRLCGNVQVNLVFVLRVRNDTFQYSQDLTRYFALITENREPIFFQKCWESSSHWEC